ncbi:Smr/MutS family protein [Sphingomonas sp.]|uniref:Smr/MutS family protein n=1 Tax=Sphingomonas sp. TaxID=28214 RepID=UPI003B009AAF
MPPDPDGDDEADLLWAAVTATVRPMAGRKRPAVPARAVQPPAPPGPRLSPSARPPAAPRPARIRDTLDGGWDRRLKRGTVAPDLTIDLHGHTLAAAHAALDTGLSRAIACDARLVLIVAGRMPREGNRLDSPLRGIIRASLDDWLAHSRHAAQIAAVRPSHPRHGGAGALYLILRRRR